jgi:hypothetical protein
MIRTGLEILLASHIHLLEGRRVGLTTPPPPCFRI